jgi:hypothetical protein
MPSPPLRGNMPQSSKYPTPVIPFGRLQPLRVFRCALSEPAFPQYLREIASASLQQTPRINKVSHRGSVPPPPWESSLTCFVSSYLTPLEHSPLKAKSRLDPSDDPDPSETPRIRKTFRFYGPIEANYLTFRLNSNWIGRAEGNMEVAPPWGKGSARV